MPADSGLALIIVLHLDPARENRIAEVLQTSTTMKVVQAADQRLEADYAYVIAPDTTLEVRDGRLRAESPRKPGFPPRPVDDLFSSLAQDWGVRAIAVILSGTGTSGSKGMCDVKARGGLCLVQDPETAEFDGMPESAIATGAPDYVLAPEDMPSLLVEYATDPETVVRDKPSLKPDRTGAFDRILWRLGESYGVPFLSSYKRGTIERRAARRMAVKQLPNWQSYLDVLEADGDELGALYRELLIGVTEFFRDPDVWKQLESDIIPRLIVEHRSAPQPIKIWVPACATGEEAYGLAIVFLEQMARLQQPTKVRIFASDVAEGALRTARRGRYPAAIAETVSDARLARYFRREGPDFVVTREVREMVTFASQNLLTDPPFSGLDLVSCRNLLIYLEGHAQQRVLELFHFALKRGGILILGASESVAQPGAFFEVASQRARVYRATAASAASRRYPLHRDHSQSEHPSAIVAPSLGHRGSKLARSIEQIVLSKCTCACVAVSDSFEIQAFFGPTHEFLIQPTGEARLNVLAWARPGLYAKLRPALEQARERKARVQVTGLLVEDGATNHGFDCTIEPITPIVGEAPFYLVAFRSSPQARKVEVSNDAAMDPLLVRQLEAELKSTREDLQSTIEQLETTSDECRASHEELLSLNEELQANNEELEASKEELQSLNEETSVINGQLEDKNVALRLANADLNNLWTSAAVPVIFLDRELCVRRFTPAMTSLMRIVPSDVGRSFEHIKQRFLDPTIVSDVARVMDELVPVTVEVRTEDGLDYERTVLPYRTVDDRVDGVCIAFHDITERRRTARELEKARRHSEAIVETIRTPLLVLDDELRVVSANRSFYRTFRLTEPEVKGFFLYQVAEGDWDIPELRRLLEAILPDNEAVEDYEVEHTFSRLGDRSMVLNARRMSQQDQAPLILIGFEDITARRHAERQADLRFADLAEQHRRKDEFLAMLGHELRNPLAALRHGVELLSLTDEDPARSGQIRQMMDRQSKHMRNLLEQLLDVARLTAAKFRIIKAPVDLVGVARVALEAAAPLVEARRHELSAELPAAGELFVDGDEMRLTQVMENLLTNAAKYTEDCGRIEFSLSSNATQAFIRVRDTGIGIEPELLPQIFELFTQGPRSLDRAGGGLGLGLPLVRRVVELHGGQVEASSEGRGEGSEFVVTLPRTVAPAGAPNAASAKREGDVRRHRILVVDDIEDNANVLVELLSLKGHEARAAYSGAVALELARTFHPDVVLLDIGLPEMDGYEVARQLRASQPETPMRLVALSGYQEDPERMRRAGFDRHLLKPANMQTLFDWLLEWQGSADHTTSA